MEFKMSYTSLRLIVPTLLVAALSLSSASALANSTFRYDAEGGLLTLEAQQMPLRDFLEEIAAVTGLTVRIMTEDTHPVTLTAERLPLEAVLKNALRGTNHMFRYQNTAEGDVVLSGVQVIGSGDDVEYLLPVSTTEQHLLSSSSQTNSDSSHTPTSHENGRNKVLFILQDRAQRGIPLSQTEIPASQPSAYNSPQNN